MKYLIPMFDCFILKDKIQKFNSNVKYQIKSLFENCVVFPAKQGNPFVLDLNMCCDNVLKVKYLSDDFYFLFPRDVQDCSCALVKYNNKELLISISNKIYIVLDGVLICEKSVDRIKFSHSEILGELCVLYFTGRRNFLCVIKNSEILFCDYYDECNVLENEKYFMCKLFDSLNHGNVCKIKDNNLTQYLVYLDDFELNLKEEFVPFVFLDCVLAGNYKYCNQLLSESLKLKNENEIKNFFSDFDFYYPLKKNTFALLKKNTLAGIFEFEINNLNIENIRNV